MSTEFRGITLWQPWASAVALGLKRFETRNRKTEYRGAVLIHASRRWTRGQAKQAARIQSELLNLLGPNDHRAEHLWPNHLGRVVAVADLVECWPTNGMPPAKRWGFVDEDDFTDDVERLFGDFSPGRFAWQLENVIRLREPVPCLGTQSLWTPDAKTVDDVKDQMRGS